MLERHYVTAERMSDEVHWPEQFPAVRAPEPAAPSKTYQTGGTNPALRRPEWPISQSERDWAFARRALRRGEPKEAVIAAIASYRRFQKPKLRHYAELTVEKAARSLQDSERTAEPELSGLRR